MSGPSAEEVLSGLRAGLADEGLHVVMPLSRARFDAACAGVAPPLAAWLPGAEAALLVGDGGPAFFARFEAARVRAAATGETGVTGDPLDDFTRARVAEATAGVLHRWDLAFRIVHPFVGERPALPFQRLGRAAGLPDAGPLGLQVHPVFGPWWAYRACVILPVVLAESALLPSSCAACARPCVVACPGRAVTARGFDVVRCSSHRHIDPACQLSCDARVRCPVGTEHRYPAHQLAFHMRASLPPALVVPPPSSSSPRGDGT